MILGQGGRATHCEQMSSKAKFSLPLLIIYVHSPSDFLLIVDGVYSCRQLDSWAGEWPHDYKGAFRRPCLAFGPRSLTNKRTVWWSSPNQSLILRRSTEQNDDLKWWIAKSWKIPHPKQGNLLRNGSGVIIGKKDTIWCSVSLGWCKLIVLYSTFGLGDDDKWWIQNPETLNSQRLRPVTKEEKESHADSVLLRLLKPERCQVRIEHIMFEIDEMSNGEKDLHGVQMDAKNGHRQEEMTKGIHLEGIRRIHTIAVSNVVVFHTWDCQGFYSADPRTKMQETISDQCWSCALCCYIDIEGCLWAVFIYRCEWAVEAKARG